MATPRYLAAVRDLLTHFEEPTQLAQIDQAADLIVHALAHGGAIFTSSIGHYNQHDFINRAGGLAAVHQFSFNCNIEATVADVQKNRPRAEEMNVEFEKIRFAVTHSNLRPGDVMMIGSVSGKNSNPVELAMACQEFGVKVIAFTSLAYTSQVESLHPSGKKLIDVCDVWVDSGAPFGDAAVQVPGYDACKLLPVSGVGHLVSGWMIFERALEKMAEAGTPASVFMSFNRPGGQEFYDKQLARYQELGY